MKEGSIFKAVALSGPSGGFVPRVIPVEYLPAEWVGENLAVDADHFDIMDLQT